MTERIGLDGTWELAHFQQGTRNLADPGELATAGLRRIPARVPGSVEPDLAAAGEIPDPYVGENMRRLADLEAHEWWYRRTFPSPAVREGQAVRLLFEGIDCFATVWLNGRELGGTANMFIAHSFDVTDLLAGGGENELVVRIRSAVLEARRLPLPGAAHAMMSNWESVAVRKAPHMYGWDIAPRAVSAGLWRSVALEVEGPDRLEAPYWAVRELKDGAAKVAVRWSFSTRETDLSRFRLRFSGSCGGSRFSVTVPARFTCGCQVVEVPHARLWWPRGYGEAALYDASVELLRDGSVADRRAERIGLRTVELERRDIVPGGGPGEFLLRVNGAPILCKGSNWVPMDAFHGRDAERYRAAIDLAVDCGCNILRCWGGNVYEDHAFFSLCDENGILVWQDFAYACALYPEDDAFLAEVRREAEAVVRKLRNHPSLALWCGDNEVDMFAVLLDRDPNMNRITRQVLPHVCGQEDPARPYLPSSPYVSPEAWKANRDRPRGDAALDKAADGMRLLMDFMPEQHLWGPRDYFKSAFYFGNRAPFVSEIGYHGCPNVSSLKRFLDPDHLWPWKDDPQWILHAAESIREGGPYRYRIQLMADQIAEMFGRIPENLEDFALASQASQAEAKKSFIETARIAKWSRTGVIWWNLIDCWPQFSDAVVDWYYGRKLAYWYIRRAQVPVAVLLGEPEDWHCALTASNDTLQPARGRCTACDADSGVELWAGDYEVPANGTLRLGRVRASRGERRMILIRWTVGGEEFGNHALVGSPPFDLERYKGWIRRIAELPLGFDAATVAR